MESNVENWLQQRLSRLSLRDLHFYTIFFILIFFVIFSSLLIYDEYRQFSKASAQTIVGLQGHPIALKGRMIKVILEISTLALILFGFIIGVGKIVNSMIARDMERFLEFFEAVHHKKISIASNGLFFDEFKKMAGYANDMAKTIHDQRATLVTLNENLEQRVQDKTKALQIQNKALEEEKAFSQDLLASQKQFIRYAIHETNTPLSVIMTNIELYTLKEGRNRYLSKIEAAVKNLSNIYDDLGYLVKKDQIEYPKQIIDVEYYIRGRIAFFDEVAQHAGHLFEIQGSCEGAKIYFNETKLQRIVDNNLTNAIKYTEPNEKILVTFLVNDQTVNFSVESHSKPIEDIEKIFEAYYRERKKMDGFGLGLNLVKSICDEEGVAINIESNEKSTKFEYLFMRESA